ELHVEPERMHVLGVELHGRREEFWFPSDRLEQTGCVPRMMRSEFRIVVLPGGGSGRKARVLRHVVGPPHAHEAAALENRTLGAVLPERLDEGGDVVGIARDDLQKAILSGNERLVVDSHRIRLAEAELAALRQKALGTREGLIELLVLVAGGSAVDDDRRPLE